MNCYQAKAGELAKQWFVIDASGQVVGRLAAQIAPILMGKHRPTYTPHIDTGDYVIVTNVDKVIFTGNKWQEKSYQRYSGYPGGQRDEAAWKLFQRRPERILELAIQRMMPKSKLGRHMMDKLKLVRRPRPSPPGPAACPAGGALRPPRLRRRALRPAARSATAPKKKAAEAKPQPKPSRREPSPPPARRSRPRPSNTRARPRARSTNPRITKSRARPRQLRAGRRPGAAPTPEAGSLKRFGRIFVRDPNHPNSHG